MELVDFNHQTATKFLKDKSKMILTMDMEDVFMEMEGIMLELFKIVSKMDTGKKCILMDQFKKVCLKMAYFKIYDFL